MPQPPTKEQALARTEQFAADLASTFGGELISVILYGGLARGEFDPKSSDINLLLVFQEISIQTLEKLAPKLDRVRFELEVNPLCIALSELDQSAEPFAIKFRDICRHHRVLAGRAIPLQTTIGPERLKRQCLRDLVNLQLRLRLFYLRQHKPERAIETILQTLPGLLTVLSTMIELQTGSYPETKSAVADRASALGLSSQTLHRFLQLKESSAAPSAREVRELYADYMKIVAQAAALAQEVKHGMAH